MNEKIKEGIKSLHDDGSKLLSDFIDDKEEKKTASLRRKYQIWYTKALIVIKEILPDRYEEFTECYSCSKRKEISYSNFSMNDYLIGICISRGGVRQFDPRSAGLIRFATQLDIVKSICENMDDVLFNIKSNIEFEIMDNELAGSKKLSKKDPAISDFNDLFKQENVYDVVNWRFIQHLGDIRNLCDHNKDREPTKDEVQELIDGTDKVIKTIF